MKHIILWLFVALWPYNALSAESKRKPEYELTVVTWYGIHVGKKTQVLEKFKRLTTCESRAAGIEKEWMTYDEDRYFVGIVTCLERT